jgi:hypothetical protein
MVNIDRKAQFQPLADLLPREMTARIAADAAVNALETQQAVVDGIEKTFSVLAAKVQPYGGATPQDFVQFGMTAQALQDAQAQIPALRAEVDRTIAVFNQLWQQGRVLYFQILDNPGAVEKVV